MMRRKRVLGALLAAAAGSVMFGVSGCQPPCEPAPCPYCVQTVCGADAPHAAHGALQGEEALVMQGEAASGTRVGLRTRAEIDARFKWNKSRLFESNEAFEAALNRLPSELNRLDSCHTFEDAATLKQCLDMYFELHTSVNRLTLYANMTVDTEPSTQTRLMQTRALSVLSILMEKAKGIRTGILKMTPEQLAAFLAAEPGLQASEAYIRNLMRRSSRVLNAEAERVLMLAGDNLWAEIDLNEIPSDAEKVFDSIRIDMKLPVIRDESGHEVQLTLSNYTKYRRSPERSVRRAAVEGLMKTLMAYENVFASTYVAQLKLDVLFARARHYDTALEAYLDKDDIPVSIYENLVQTVNANLAPLHRYVSLRKQVMGVDTVHLYDMYVPLADGVPRQYTYEEATALIAAALEPLGEAFVSRLKEEMSLSSGSIDLYPHADKSSGAYSCSVYGIAPFILMNYHGGLDDVSTLAHEFGHSMHSILAMEAQPPGSFHYTMFLAEIASTVNEALMNDYMLRHAQTDAERIDLLVQKLENIRGTIYRQTLFAEFEYLTHTAIEQGEAIQAQWLSDLYATLLRKYYGPDYTIDTADGHEWAYIPHFYYKYYVYSYATGLSSALSFARLIAASPENAQRYIDMLKAGGSKNSVTLLREAGVDLSTPAPIELALKEFDETVTALEALLLKR